MSLMVEALGTRGRLLSSIGVPVRLENLRGAAARPSARVRRKTLKRVFAPVVLAACDLFEMTIEAAGFGLLMVLFLASIYVLGAR